ncbi:hypothetical protein IQ07DRAFT_681664 [Pyrenochaeta sp. DS3sAY3a]|nr:hypothetical protein IQ07DRAFT_681664 [Pyrenochaeta sp. DS3sAY3a]
MPFRFHQPNEAAIVHSSRISDETWEEFRPYIERVFYAGGPQGYKQAHEWIGSQAIDDFNPTLRQVRYRLKQIWNCHLLTRKALSIHVDSESKPLSETKSFKTDPSDPDCDIKEEENTEPRELEATIGGVVLNKISEYGKAVITECTSGIRCRKREESPAIDQKRLKRQESGDDLADIEHMGVWIDDSMELSAYQPLFQCSPPRNQYSKDEEADSISISDISDIFAEMEIDRHSVSIIEEHIDIGKGPDTVLKEPGQAVEAPTHNGSEVESTIGRSQARGPATDSPQLIAATHETRRYAASMDQDTGSAPGTHSSDRSAMGGTAEPRRRSFAYADDLQPRDGG